MAERPLDILYRDDHLIAVNKPAGIATHAGVGHQTHNLVRLVQQWCEREGIDIDGPLAPANRLDREVSGVVLFALDSSTRTALGKLVQDGALRKVYWAVAAGRMRAKGVINRDVPVDGNIKRARTRYRLLATSGRSSLVKVTIETGRKHQIRRHLASIGHPILGDQRYGHTKAASSFRRRFEAERIMLHARQITCAHPVTGDRLHIVCSPEPQWDDIVEQLALEAV